MEDCTLVVAAQQLRIHSARRCDFLVRMRSGPIIEHSSQVRFAPYGFSYPALAAQMRAFGLHEGKYDDVWSKVEDFNWLRTQQSPNWSVIPDGARPLLTVAPPAPAVTTTGAPDVTPDEM